MDKRNIQFHEELRSCLLAGTETMLRRKAALGENVAYAGPDGVPYEMSAKEALEIFLKTNIYKSGDKE